MINILKILIENSSLFPQISKEFNLGICSEKNIHNSGRILYTLEVYFGKEFNKHKRPIL